MMRGIMEGDGEDVGHHGGRWGGCGPSCRVMGMMWAIMEGDGLDARHRGGRWGRCGPSWKVREVTVRKTGHTASS